MMAFFGFAVLMFFNQENKINNSAFFKDSVDAEVKEEEFNEPVNIVWTGKITSVMSGGFCLALEGGFDGHNQILACLPETSSYNFLGLSGEVTVIGRWLGITCAYENTIFGECVPDVEVESIE